MNDMQIAIEAKASVKITAAHLCRLRNLVQDYTGAQQRIVVFLKRKSCRTKDGGFILSAAEFCNRFNAGGLF
jgi:hypothetical protein